MNIKTANRLLDLRKSHNFSQEQLAEKIGVSRQAVSKWERAEASPDIDNLILLSKLYNMTLDQLINDDNISFEDNFAKEDIKSGKAEFPQVQSYSTLENSHVYAKQQENTAVKESVDQVLDQEDISAFKETSAIINEIHSAEEEINHDKKIRKKRRKVFRPSNMPYPVIVTFIYLVLGFYFGWWHPGWLVFLTIPIYYNCFVDDDEEY